MSGVVDALAGLGRFGAFSGAVAARVVGDRWSGAEVAGHTWTFFVRTFVPVVAVNLPFGVVLALQGLKIFELFGAERMLASLVVVAVLRELSPVLSSLLVAAQGGSSVAAELGAMRIKEELDATAVMAVDGITLHVVPRVLAMVLVCPLLDIVGCVAGIGGAWLTATSLQGEPGGVFLAELWSFAAYADVVGSLIKAATFGAIIGLTATYLGWSTQGGAAGVGRAVNDTVVRAVLAFSAANYLLTSAMVGWGP